MRPISRALPLLVGASLAATPLSTWAQTYTPPPRGAPGGRIGGASRSAAVPVATLPIIEPLAPADHAGLSARADPTLYYFLSRPSTWSMAFTIAAPGQPAPVLEVAIQPPDAAGIYPLSLAHYHIRLQPGIDYTWSVSVVIDPHAWSHNIVASAGIVFDPAQAAALAATPSPTVTDFAADGLWYDAIAGAVAEARGPGGRGALDSLLRQVGLPEVTNSAVEAVRPQHLAQKTLTVRRK
jgi:hypothetical protein